jgi:hypothetical protein
MLEVSENKMLKTVSKINKNDATGEWSSLYRIADCFIIYVVRS